ncbi:MULTISPECIES: YezD family protein [Bacillaceae]|uniref:YezD family protein n=1 Tax=Bacillaceae TaxID=186817 RepID=UPI0021CCE177|nr:MULTISPECIES: YezD family protein [Bacillaceae]WRP04703.1 YezD family protein [Rossellomorea aquimaris]
MTKENNQEAQYDVVVEKITSMLKTMSFGSITIVVQDGKVIQLEKNEKVRIK